MRTLKLVLASSLAVFALGTAATAQTQSAYPNKPIRLIVPYTTGGTADSLSRYVSDELGKALGQPVVIDFKPGGSLIVGAQAASVAKPDGYTLFMGTGTSNVLNALLRANLPYDPDKDFDPVAMLTENQYVLAVPATSEAKDLQSFLKLARSKPGQLSYSTWGAGNLNHLGVEQLSQLAGIKMQAVPYKGSSQADLDLMAGRIDFALTTPTIMPFVKDGRARAIAVTSSRRSAFAPDVPTIAEQGFPDFEVTGWFAIFAPKGTPEAIIQRLNTEINRVMQGDAIRERFVGDGLVPVSGPPSMLSERIALENRVWGAVIDSLNLRGKLGQ